ncbi:MAG TPA: hypothetical protein VLY23_10555 [Candidatus Acidoferrum sp.]|nr:hypothetical protein [Candidatus Acidoferrum sp.]
MDEAVQGFDNKAVPLVPTLLSIAETYHIPIGIEKVTPSALSSALPVRLDKGTIGDLMDLCVSQLPDYAWKTEKGVIIVYGPSELADPSNLFNLRIPDFSVRNSTLNDANNLLRSLVLSAPGPRATTPTPPNRAVGMGGDSPGIGALEEKHVDITLKDATVREILDQIVALSDTAGQPVAWIANVPPERLNQPTSGGLWRLVPVGRPAPKH